MGRAGEGFAPLLSEGKKERRREPFIFEKG